MNEATGRSKLQMALPILLLKNYLHFLSRRPISGSNLHFKAGRIASLQSLAPLLEQTDSDEVRQFTHMLRTLTTTNLARFAPQILRQLQRHKEPPIPRNLVASVNGPDADFFAGAKKTLLILGQGIGIGDEILTFPLAGTLRRRMEPDGSLKVLSSYRELWRDVEGVDNQALYGGLQELVDAIRSGEYDLVVMVDFERPGLLSTMCEEAAVSRYIELAMGLRELSALDKRTGRLWKLERPEPYYANFYHHMERMQRWLGGEQSVKLLPRHTEPVKNEVQVARELVIYASPFTSKEDPSERYWADLLLAMLPEKLSTGMRIKILVDSGANFSTRAFAVELAKAIDGAGRERVRCETASSVGLSGSLLSLADAMRRIERADVIVTSDSFPAHAGQLYGKLTLVLARDGVENWRAPAAGNFYLRAGHPLNELSMQARVLLRDLAGLGGDEGGLRFSKPVVMLKESAEQLRRALLDDQKSVPKLWTECRECTRAVIEGLQMWTPGYEVLVADHDYTQLLPVLPEADLSLLELQLHLRCRLAEWLNSNLLKYARWGLVEDVRR